jgi:hypothetical protein
MSRQDPGAAKVTGHVWRPQYSPARRVRNLPAELQPCAYMSCGRCKGEHERSFRPKSRQPHARLAVTR